MSGRRLDLISRKISGMQPGDRIAKHAISHDGKEYYQTGTIERIFINEASQEVANVLLDSLEMPHQSFLTCTLRYARDIN